MNNIKEKICLIFQPLGIGDVLYTQAIGQHYADKGYRVIWPLASQIMYIKDYISYPGIEFVNREVDFPRKDYYIETNTMILDGDFVFLPLANASHRIPSTSILFMNNTETCSSKLSIYIIHNRLVTNYSVSSTMIW